MTDYLMKIRLLSDLCVADGGIYNSSIDTDICYDSYGLPFIPAKRIKGCLRECGIELRDWGEELPLEEIFGAGRKSGWKADHTECIPSRTDCLCEGDQKGRWFRCGTSTECAASVFLYQKPDIH